MRRNKINSIRFRITQLNNFSENDAKLILKHGIEQGLNILKVDLEYIKNNQPKEQSVFWVLELDANKRNGECQEFNDIDLMINYIYDEAIKDKTLSLKIFIPYLRYRIEILMGDD